MLTRSTPVELHNGIWVKREDLCSVPPAPPFSKYRGVEAHIAKRPEQVIGVLDTLHSKAGWAVAAACQELGKRCVNYYPTFSREEPGTIRPYQQKAAELGAELVSMPATMSAVLWFQARMLFHEHYPQPGLLSSNRETGYMMPNALKLDESAAETAIELAASTKSIPVWPDHVIVSVSSGTIAAGVLRGLTFAKFRPQVTLHLGYSRPENAVRKYIQKLAQYPQNLIRIVDEGYRYSDAVPDFAAPFPCNAYYDLKAWKWTLRKNWYGKSVLFWNIGA